MPESANPTPWAVWCPSHGKVYLDNDEYMEQLSRPNNLWVCPCCFQEAQWDDGNYARMTDDNFVEESE